MEGQPTTTPPPTTTTVTTVTVAPTTEKTASDNSTGNSTAEEQPASASGNITKRDVDSAPPSVTVKEPESESNATTDAPSPKDVKYSGYVVDILDKLSQALGVTYEISIVPDNRYGKKEGDKWNGLIGQVCDGV